MESQNTKTKFLESDEFVISETRKIQALYRLKTEIRYAQSRDQIEDTESVAEHIYGMHCISTYFLELEDPEATWNRERISQMIQFHDIDEIETGDTIGYLKSTEDIKNEIYTAKRVIATLPLVIQNSVVKAMDEYDAQKTIESKFVKALDKIEPLFHLYNEEGKALCKKNKVTREQSDSVKIPYVQEFETTKRFYEVLTKQFEKEGFFHTSA